jgi:UDP-N-acetylglucosamine 2-epimerase (non-hydrolysing)
VFWNIEVLFKIRKILKKHRIENVLYHGDTMTTATASIAALGYNGIHLEAGLRSENWKEPFPEEMSRKIADKCSRTLFTATERAHNNVLGYKRKNIHLIGNTISDSLKIALKQNKGKKRLSKEKFALITLHRHENIRNRERMENIVEILESIPIESYFALHDNTKKKLIKFDLYERLMKSKVEIISSMDYLNFIYQMSECSLVVCDGGSMQEESLIFNKPCIILRKATERQEGLETNFQFLSHFNVNETKQKIFEYLNPSFKINKVKNPYGKNVSKLIVDILQEMIR